MALYDKEQMNNRIAFVYKWTHIPTNKWYVGSRTAKECHLNDGYICSSKLVKKLILKNRNEWKREILAIGKPLYIRNLESRYLERINAAQDPMSFNQSNGEKNFFMTGKNHTEFTKNKIRKKLFGKKQSNDTKLKKSKRFSGKGNAFYGKHHTEETKQLLRNLYLGTLRPKEVKIKIAQSLLGKKRKAETKIKISKSVQKLQKISCEYCGKMAPPATHGRWHGDNCNFRSKL